MLIEAHTVNNQPQFMHFCLVKCLKMSRPACLDTVFERLQQPVDASECTVKNGLTNQDALIYELPQSKTVCPVELYPITQQLELMKPIPVEIWSADRPQLNTMWSQMFRHYTTIQTVDTYESVVLSNEVDVYWGISLFGIRFNSLKVLLHLTLVSHLNQCEESLCFLLHSVSVIVLQYYLMQRNQWLQVCADSTGVLSDKFSPFICMLYMRYDVKRGFCNIDFDKCPLPQAALQYDFISLVHSVMSMLRVKINAWIQPHSKTLELTQCFIDDWCNNKLFATKTQYFVTTRFVLLKIKDYSNQILKSLQLDQMHNSNAIVQSKFTKHFKLIKHHKMHELDCIGRDPLENTPTQPDVLKVSEASFSVFHAKIPTLMGHFYFNPFEPVAAHSLGVPFAKVWLQPCSNERVWLCKFLFHSLQECAKLIDSSLASVIRKSFNRLHHKWRTVKPKPQSSKVSLVRLRYAYTIDDYHLLTELSDGLSLHRNPEYAPQFISIPQWNHLLTRKGFSAPPTDTSLSQFELNGWASVWAMPNNGSKIRQPSIETAAGTFEHFCVLHAAACVLQCRGLFNYWLVWHGLCLIYGNEHESLQFLQRQLALNSAELRAVVTEHFDDAREWFSNEITTITVIEEIRTQLRQQYQFRMTAEHPSSQQYSELLNTELRRFCWLKLHGEQFNQASPQRQTEINLRLESGTQQLFLHYSSVITGYFRLFCPTPVIPKSNNTVWTQFAVLEQKWPVCFKMLHQISGFARSSAFQNELTKNKNELTNGQADTVAKMPMALIDSCVHIINTLQHETDSDDTALLQLLTKFSQLEPESLNVKKQMLLQKLQRIIGIRLRFGDESDLMHLIVHTLLPELCTLFEEAELIPQAVNLLQSANFTNQLLLTTFEKSCYSALTATAKTKQQRMQSAFGRVFQLNQQSRKRKNVSSV